MLMQLTPTVKSSQLALTIEPTVKSSPGSCLISAQSATCTLLPPQADMEKAKIAQRAAQQAADEEAAQRSAEAAAADVQATYERDIAAKQASLPAEPAPDAQDAITVMVRLPDGRRASRRRVRCPLSDPCCSTVTNRWLRHAWSCMTQEG